MDIAGVVFVKRHRLKQNVVAVVAIDVLGDVNYFMDGVSDLEGVWVHLLADFALKTLPVEASHVGLGAVLRSLLLLLRLQPVFQALEVDEADRAFALAGDDKRVFGRLLGGPADAALNLVDLGLARLDAVLGRADLLGLSKFLLVELIRTHLERVAAEVLHAEADPAELDGVKLLNFVVVLAILVLEGASDKPETVHRLLLDLLTGDGMVQVITLVVLLKESEAAGLRLLALVDDVIELREVDLVLVSNDLALRLGLEGHFDDVAGLVVEEAVGVTQPRDGAEENTKELSVWLLHFGWELS
jgi:hypothetical protein